MEFFTLKGGDLSDELKKYTSATIYNLCQIILRKIFLRLKK